MRILAIGSMYPPHHYGGYELVWQSAMRRARAEGHQVRILASEHRIAGRGEDDPDVYRDLRWYWSWELDDWVRLGIRGRLGLERHNARLLAEHITDLDPDVVTWWPMGGMSLSMIEQVHRRGIPSVLVVHDDWLLYGPRRDAWMRLWKGRRRNLGIVVERLTGLPTHYAVSQWGCFLFNSQHTRDVAVEHGVAPVDARVLSPGVHERFLGDAPMGRWDWELRYVGRVDPNKGIQTAVAALPLLPLARLSIIGDGHVDFIRDLQGQARALGCGDRLRFIPAVDPAALPEIYLGADAILFPVHWDEPWGLVPLEAMAMGRPVVATARGGSQEFLRDGENALIVPPGDAAAIATAVKRLAGEPELRARLAVGGKLTARAHRAADFDSAIGAELGRAVATPEDRTDGVSGGMRYR